LNTYSPIALFLSYKPTGNSEKDLDEAHEEAAKNEQKAATEAAAAALPTTAATPEPATATAV
jgi:hypothetical protein